MVGTIVGGREGCYGGLLVSHDTTKEHYRQLSIEYHSHFDPDYAE